MAAQEVTIALSGEQTVAGLWQTSPACRACLVLAHGAGADMRHQSMASLAEGLKTRGIASLRYQFLFTERRSRRPDPPAVAHRAVRGAVAAAPRWAGSLPLVAGGRSFGGRMTSQAQALDPLPGVRGLVFFAFPLHPADKPSIARADHLRQVEIPLIFVQGSRDGLADMALLRPVVDDLGARATLTVLDGADHAFHVPKGQGRSDAEVMADGLDRAVRWIDILVS